MNATEIFAAVIELLVALAVALLIPYIKNRISAEKLENALTYVDIFVEAAEQLYEETDGEAKFEFVFEKLQEKGIELDYDELEAAIESAVLRLHAELRK
jgi:hypothetical protein